MSDCQIHPAAELFPMMDAASFAELKEDIRINGQREWCDLYKGQLLDGRNRWKACEALGIEPLTCELDDADGFDPVQYVLSKNLHRRHLTEAQRAIIAVEASAIYAAEAEQRMKSGKAADPTAPVQQGSAAKKAAEQMGVSERLVYQAKAVVRDGAPEVADAVRRGDLTVKQAERFVKAVRDKKSQAKVIESVRGCSPKTVDCVVKKRITQVERTRASKAAKAQQIPQQNSGESLRESIPEQETATKPSNSPGRPINELFSDAARAFSSEIEFRREQLLSIDRHILARDWAVTDVGALREIFASFPASLERLLAEVQQRTGGAA